MRGRRLSIAAAIVVLGALVLATGAQACSCVRMAPEDALSRADAAIVGELVEVIPQDGQQAEYRYRVQHVYKRGQGIRRDRVISVRSSRQSAACGLPARVGHRYGLLLLRADGGWSSGLCGVLSPRLLRKASCTS